MAKVKKIENFLGRILYLHNTINTHFILMGFLGVFVYHFLVSAIFNNQNFFSWFIYSLVVSVFLYFCFKLADFYWLFLLAGPIFCWLFFGINNFELEPALNLTFINIVLFFLTQFVFFGMVYILILRDLTTPLRIAFNSLLTLASTTASFWMSLFFTSFFSFSLLYQPNPISQSQSRWFFISIFLAALFIRPFVPQNRDQQYNLPKRKNPKPIKRVVLLNIDGCSFQKFSQAKTVFINNLKKKSVFFNRGALTVYRGLTNPAFASILTGTTPKIHRVVDNNLGSRIKTRALPDIISTIIYGSVHMKQFAKKDWRVKVVSLPKYGFKADEVVLKWVKKDIETDRARLFIIDLSSVDMAGHAYGSYSKEYTKQIERADQLIAGLIKWLVKRRYLRNSMVIVSSDHGMKIIDHTYLSFKEEREVPLLFYGPGVKKGKIINSQPSIMDIAVTISYALGINYPEKTKAMVLKEIFR